MAQERRSEIVQGCLEGKYSVVVATNVLGRGVDLVNVKQVVLHISLLLVHLGLRHMISFLQVYTVEPPIVDPPR